MASAAGPGVYPLVKLIVTHNFLVRRLALTAGFVLFSLPILGWWLIGSGAFMTEAQVPGVTGALMAPSQLPATLSDASAMHLGAGEVTVGFDLRMSSVLALQR